MSAITSPALPQEELRLEALKSYDIMDSLPEQDYDDITYLAAQLCGTAVSLISFIDDKRQWFKSATGTEVRETPKEAAFCAHTIRNGGKTLIVPDTRRDERFANNPLVTGAPHVVFYAGAPLITDSGFALGSVCVVDSKTHTLTTLQENSLRILARHVVTLLELRKKNNAYKRLQAALEERNAELEAALTARH